MYRSDLTLDLLEGHSTTDNQRDGIRISKDAILAMYLLDSVVRPLNLTFTLKFEVNSSVEVNVTVESKVDGRYVNTDNKSLTLNIPDLNLTSKVGLRTELVREEGGGDWVPNKMCTERVQVLEMCSGFHSYTEVDGVNWGPIVASVLFIVLLVGLVLWKTGNLQRLNKTRMGRYFERIFRTGCPAKCQNHHS